MIEEEEEERKEEEKEAYTCSTGPGLAPLSSWASLRSLTRGRSCNDVKTQYMCSIYQCADSVISPRPLTTPTNPGGGASVMINIVDPSCRTHVNLPAKRQSLTLRGGGGGGGGGRSRGAVCSCWSVHFSPALPVQLVEDPPTQQLQLQQQQQLGVAGVVGEMAVVAQGTGEMAGVARGMGEMAEVAAVKQGAVMGRFGRGGDHN